MYLTLFCCLCNQDAHHTSIWITIFLVLYSRVWGAWNCNILLLFIIIITHVIRLLTITLSFSILSTLCFSEVSNRREFTNNYFTGIISTIESTMSTSCLFLSHVLYINIAYHMVSNIISNSHFFKFPKFS